LAWRFDGVLPGNFTRNKVDFAHLIYPLLAPMPTAGRNTAPLEEVGVTGPFVYFVVGADQVVHYVGKSLETSVVHRWVRPGIGAPSNHYWTHSKKTGGVEFEIAKALQSGARAFSLRYAPLHRIPAPYQAKAGVTSATTDKEGVEQLGAHFIKLLSPPWNRI
jgi:hypothetical protein